MKNVLRGLFISLVLAVGFAFAQNVTITYWQYQYDSKVKAMDQIIKDFEKANPGITVKQQTFPYDAYNQRVAASVPAGIGPDVINLYYGWLPLYVDSGYLQPLPTDAFPPAEIEKDFTPMVKASELDGKYWALPTAVRTLALFYNKDLFKQAGIAGPPKTWDEFVADAKKLTKGSNGRYSQVGFAIAPNGQGHNLLREVMFRQWGTAPYSDDNKKVTYANAQGAAALQVYTDWVTKDHIGVLNYFPGDNGYRDAFNQGLAGMIIDGSFAIGTLEQGATMPWGVAELPTKGADGLKSNFGSYWANAITRNATGAKLNASIKFLKYLTSEEVMRYWLKQVGEIPARASLAKDPDLLNDPVYGPFIASLSYAHSTFFVDEAGQRQVMLDAINRVILKGDDPLDSLKQAASDEQKILDKFWNNRK